MKQYERYDDETLVAMFRQGDAKVADYLLDKYKPLVRREARALYLAGGDQEDLLQEGMLGLFKAVQAYDPEKEISFASFATLCISRQMYSAVLSAGRQKHAPLNESISLNELEEQTGEIPAAGMQNMQSPETIVLQREAYENDLLSLRKLLSPLEKKVLELYMEGMDYREIADRLSRPEKSIDNALHRIRIKAQGLKSKTA